MESTRESLYNLLQHSQYLSRSVHNTPKWVLLPGLKPSQRALERQSPISVKNAQLQTMQQRHTQTQAHRHAHTQLNTRMSISGWGETREGWVGECRCWHLSRYRTQAPFSLKLPANASSLFQTMDWQNSKRKWEIEGMRRGDHTVAADRLGFFCRHVVQRSDSIKWTAERSEGAAHLLFIISFVITRMINECHQEIS